jgi:WD40 repeat protein
MEIENLINYFFDHIYMGCNEVISVINKEYKTIEGKYLSHAVQTKHNIIDLHQLDTVPTKIHTVISKNCKYIAYKVLAELGVEIYDFNTNQLLRKLTVYGYTLTGVEFTPNEKYLVTSQTVGDNALTIWNVETGQKEYEYLPAGYQCIAISHDGKYLANGIRSIALYKLDIHTDIPPTNNTIIEVFPNPAFDNVNVELDKEYLNIKWAIIDLTGAAVLSGVQPSGNFSINTANLPSATYNLTLTIDGKSTSYPLIIAR